MGDPEGACRQQLRAWIAACKADDGCDRCGAADPRRLEYRPVSSAGLALPVDEMVSAGCSKAVVRATMERRRLLCADCAAVSGESDSV